MNSLFRAFLACAALLVWQSAVALADGDLRRAPTLSSAQEMAKKSPGDIVVIVTGSDWNATSKKFKTDVIDSPGFQKAFGDEVILVEIDRAEGDPDGKKARQYTGANDLRRYVFRVPMIGLYDSTGRDIGQFAIGLEKMPVESVVKSIKQRISLRQKRDQLWADANKATGAKRAELLGQGLAVIGIGWGRNEDYHPRRNEYQPMLDELKKADPDDSAGWMARFSFDPDQLFFDCEELWKKNQHDESLAKLDRLLKNPTFTPEYRQRVLALKYAAYKRWPGHEKESLAMLRQIDEIDSKSFMGLGARGWTNYLTGPADLVYGWRNQNVTAEYSTWNIPISDVLSEPGFYRLKLEQAGSIGSKNIVIRSLAVEVNGKAVWSVNKELRPTIEEVIELPAAGTGRAVLIIQAKGDGGTDSYGTIILEPFYLRREKK